MKEIVKALHLLETCMEGRVIPSGRATLMLPVETALQMDTQEQAVVVLLCACVEQCGVTIQQLIDEGFRTKITETVDLVRFTEERDMLQYLDTVASVPLAWKVRIASLVSYYASHSCLIPITELREEMQESCRFELTELLRRIPLTRHNKDAAFMQEALEITGHKA
jgi:hypothetical protein